MIILKVFFSSAATIGLCFLMHLFFGGSWVVWLIVGWVLSGPIVLLMFALHHSDTGDSITQTIQKKFAAWRSKSASTYDREPHP
ncbi:hypothetical protein J7399_19925 [Shimia sp. R9_1]|uniref:hypothetical protein n=1 Tax=Shimia sp. R9_1 TaxID=2821111 RepID=UPI001ADAED49|nr:hypothetical protein [Shimia sp. R9_1]MBO9409714.1 hypothetical protein [Shimia sp. R9_1]